MAESRALQVEDWPIATQVERPYLSVVIPAYNESRRLPANLPKVFAYLDGQPYAAEVIVVDDGSEDDVASIVERFQKEHPNLRLIRNPHRGKAYTVRTGVLAARGCYIFQCDADLSMPVEELAKLLKALEEGYDVVVGWRARRYHLPWYRQIMSLIYHLVVQAIVVRGVRDTQSGFKCYRRPVAHDIFRRTMLYSGEAEIKGPAVTGFDVEILFLAQQSGYRIKEVPVEWYYAERSTVNPIKDSLRNLGDVIRVRLNDLQGKYRHARAAKGDMGASAPEL